MKAKNAKQSQAQQAIPTVIEPTAIESTVKESRRKRPTSSASVIAQIQDEEQTTMPATALKTAPTTKANFDRNTTVATSELTLRSTKKLKTLQLSHVTSSQKSAATTSSTVAEPSASNAMSTTASLAVLQQTIVLSGQSARKSKKAETSLERLARRDAIILEHLNLVKAIAVRVHENLPVHLDMDDLIHAGILGLFDAAEKFDSEKMVSFSSYAKHRIKGAILDSLRQLDWASRDLRRRHKQLEALTRELTLELHRAPTEEELANRMGVPVERWREMMIDLRNVGLISASSRGNENEDLPAPDFPSSPDLQPDRICQHEQLKGMLGVAMKTLPERYQKVVLLYYSNELTMKEIGNMLGINESRVSQIHKSALEKMASAMRDAGIESPAAF